RDGQRVTQRLGHLLAGQRHPAVVQPITGETVASSFGLGPLVLVVREDQVQPTAVDVELRAEVGGGHRRALQVPAGAPSAPWRRPGRLAGSGALPHGEVPRTAFAGSGGCALARRV